MISRPPVRLAFLLFLFACTPRSVTPAALCSAPKSKSVVAALRDPAQSLYWTTAHRGERSAAPDNSKESLIASARAGVPLVEIDVRRNKSGTPFLFHNKTLTAESIAGPPEFFGRLAVNLTDYEMERVRIRNGSGDIPILFFSDALKTLKPYNTAAQLDVKDESPEAIERIVASLEWAEMKQQAVVQCQEVSTLEYMRSHHPEIATLARLHHPEDLEKIISLRPEIIFAEEERMPPETIRRIHDAGIKVSIRVMGDDIDRPATWERLFRSGADILMTDHGNAMTNFSRKTFCR